MATALPPGYSPPTSVVTADDHGAWALIACGVGLVFMLLFAILRLMMRYPFRTDPYHDDILVVAGTMFAALQAILVLTSVTKGFGKSQKLLDAHSISQIDKLLYAGDVIYLMAIFLSKISVLCLELRLSPERIQVLVVRVSLAFSGVALFAAIFMVALGCDVAHPWLQITDECNGLYARWVVIAVFGILLEVSIFVVICRLFAALQRDWTGKLKGLAVFGLRLPVIVLTILRLLALRNMLSTSDPPLARVVVVYWTQTELAYSLVTATLPCLLPVLMQLNTGMGALGADTVIKQTQKDSQNYTGGSYILQSAKRSDHSNSGNEMRLDRVVHKSTIVSPNVDQRSISSDDSTGLIIRKKVDVDVRTQGQQEIGTPR